MTKFREYYKRMIDANKEEFDAFRTIHDKYAIADDTDTLQEEYNLAGDKIQKIVKEWEQKLCSQSEKAGYGGYTGNLAEKFHEEILKDFPMYDHIGLIVKKFSIKKIRV